MFAWPCWMRFDRSAVWAGLLGFLTTPRWSFGEGQLFFDIPLLQVDQHPCGAGQKKLRTPTLSARVRSAEARPERRPS